MKQVSNKQQEVLDLYREGNTPAEIAKSLKKSVSTVYELLNRARRNFERAEVPIGQQLRGESRLEDGDGNVKLRWIKSQRDAETIEDLMNAAMEGMRDKLPREKPVRLRTKNHYEDLLNLFICTDYHLGGLSWAEETGADWDIKIAEELLIAWFKAALAQAPRAGIGVFAQLGDFLHFDGLEAITPTGANILEADTRFQKLVRVAIRVIRKVIEMMLQRYPKVVVLMCEGNHDLASSVWLREWLTDIYRDEPRIIVDNAAQPYYCYEHGKTALFFHHGHKRGIKQLDTIFAAKFREVFGRTKFAYGHTGHLHSSDKAESNLMTIEQHRTLAAADAYSTRMGFTSGREASVITYHKKYGRTGRVDITPEMVR